MQKLRSLPIAAIGLAFGLLTACDSTSSTSGPTIKDLQISNTDGTAFAEATSYLTAGGSVATYGEVTSDAGLATVRLVVTDSLGDTDVSTPYSTSSTDYVWGPGKSVTINITTTTSWLNGTHKVKLIATDKNGNQSTSSTLPLLISGGTTANGGSGSGTNISTTGSTTLGAQSSSYGSFLSITGGWSITSGLKTAADEDSIDIIFFASTNSSTGTPTFYSPAAAYAAGLGNLSGWTTRNATIIVSNGTAALSTKEAVVSAIGTSTSQSVAVTNGNWYAVELSNGTYGAIHVTSLTSSGNASTVDVSTFK